MKMAGGGGMEEVTHKLPARVDRPSPTTGGNSPVTTGRAGHVLSIWPVLEWPEPLIRRPAAGHLSSL